MKASATRSGVNSGLGRDRNSSGNQGKFDAAAHGVDAFGADADAITEFPGKRLICLR